MRLLERILVFLVALVLNVAIWKKGIGGDWPQDYIVRKNSESLDGGDWLLTEPDFGALLL